MDVEKLIEEGARALWKASALNIAGVRDLDAEWGAMSSGDRDPYITGSVAVIRRTLEWAAGEGVPNQSKGGDANASGARDASKPIPATSPGITAGASAVEDDLCGRLRVYALAEDIMSSERRDLETAATRIRSLTAENEAMRREKGNIAAIAKDLADRGYSGDAIAAAIRSGK